MANTFFKAQGYEVGASLVEEDKVELAKDLLKRGGKKLLLPVDVVVADAFAADAKHQTVAVDKVPAGWRILDIGPKTVTKFASSAQEGQDGGLERPDGRLRVPGLCRGHRGDRQGAGPERRHHASSAAATRRRRSSRPAWPTR